MIIKRATTNVMSPFGLFLRRQVEELSGVRKELAEHEPSMKKISDLKDEIAEITMALDLLTGKSAQRQAVAQPARRKRDFAAV